MWINKGERKSYHLSQAVDSGNMEMSKRLKYTKDILTHMLTNNVGGVNDENDAKGLKSATKRNLQRFSSTTGFQNAQIGSTNNLAKYSSGTKFRTLSRGPGSNRDF